jgi:hypothetical protein
MSSTLGSVLIWIVLDPCSRIGSFFLSDSSLSSISLADLLDYLWVFFTPSSCSTIVGLALVLIHCLRWDVASDTKVSYLKAVRK